ncbi:PRC-barrel domain-containing protein [Nostoc flagelliforme FACHB-838]|uniref:PRC-barrel domain-containing protein n=1 Tax=Nostoc flagelliforme FACHB-838 TaxID=2692904 RepID=A0ABR8E5W6_9NOSO|nr:PRC-barrel domain-containing protein [Nostoc flagelliforme FACHB-838]
MPLQKISEFDPNYYNAIEGSDVKGMSVYVQGTDQNIGTVSDAVVDELGAFRYLIVDLGFWISGKKVLLPVGKSRIDSTANRVYVIGLTREQAENLPEYQEHTALDYDYEEKVRSAYRTSSVEGSAPLDRGFLTKSEKRGSKTAKMYI